MKKFVYILLLFFVVNSYSQVSVEATLDTNNLLIGQQTKLSLSLTYPLKSDSINVFFPQLSDTINKNIEVVEVLKFDTLESVKDIKLTQQYIVTSFDTGYFVIKPFPFIVNGDTLFTQPLLLNVKTVEVDTSKAIFDIKQPLEEPFSFKDWLKENWPVLVAILIGILIIAGVIYYLKTRKKPEVVEKPLPKIPLHEIYLKKLIETKSKKLWQEGKYKQYYSEISDAVREYLEKRFGIQALEQTTDEIIASMKFKPVDENVIPKLYELLTTADLVKFAKEKPLAEQNENAYKLAVDIIHLTKQEELKV